MDSATRNEAIRRLRIYGEPLEHIGELFGISRQRVDQILQQEKHEAREKTKAMIAREQIERPDRCERCHRDRDLEAHHHDYADPTDVEFLCEECHTGIHGNGWRDGPGRTIGGVKGATPNTIGYRVRQRRVELRMTQADLADALDTQAPQISHYEVGNYEPQMRTVRKLARALCCSTDWLLFGSFDHLEKDPYQREKTAQAS